MGSNKLVVGVNDLAAVHPELLKEWDYEKNNILKIYPDKITYGSNKRVWWKCSKGYSWNISIWSRSHGSNCPYCANQKLLVGYNDFKTLYPDLVNEWNYEKNCMLPEDYIAGSRKKVWWKCKKGHVWQAPIYSRVNGTGCPQCSSFGTSFPEKSVYYYLNYLFGKNDDVLNRFKFDDNNVSFEIDIFIPSFSLAFEYNGIYWHRNKKEMDNYKYNCLKKVGIRLIVIKESDCNKIVEDNIFYNCKNNKLVNLSWAIKSVLELIGYNFVDVDVNRDRLKILDSYYKTKLKNSIAVVNPNLAKEWNYDKNGDLKPEYFSVSSGEKVWWKCGKGHEWPAIISNRNKGVGCPYCSNYKVLKGYNDLASVYPKLLNEWDYEKNNAIGIYPEKITYASGKKVWWKCKKGHNWKISVYNRTIKESTCPICSNKKVLLKYNDLETVRPDLAKEWNYEKNGDLLPSQVTCGSAKKVWWKCNKGHDYEASISIRNSQNTGCPICLNKIVKVGFNDLSSKYPAIAKTWDYEKNGNITPEMVVYGSGKSYWWKCEKCGKSWKTPIRIRVRGHECPNCMHENLGRYNSKNGLIVGINDLETLYPNLVKEWDYVKNGFLLPSQFKIGSNFKVWWKCQICGHEWECSIFHRVRSTGCPECVKSKRKKRAK